uniref:Uncharacterized protein n=1 Tax=Cajanus cajan TaxID=3821 RepID=A0A151RHV8_CAJCA|nr:hypothetical protein KK1_036451 [Cajanus cajan]
MVHKALTKVITSRLKHFMTRLVSWTFVVDAFLDLGFDECFIQVLYQCLSLISFQVCLNREKIYSFKSQRGLQQGDYLSPYNFVLYLERLSHLIQEDLNQDLQKSLV